MRQIDLRDAINFLALMRRENRPSCQRRIGLAERAISGMRCYIDPGTVLLFTEAEPGFINVEQPMTEEEILAQRANGSLLSTKYAMVGVPASFVVEIVLPEFQVDKIELKT